MSKQPTLSELQAIGEQRADTLLALVFDVRVQERDNEAIARARAACDEIARDIERLRLDARAVLVGRYESGL